MAATTAHGEERIATFDWETDRTKAYFNPEWARNYWQEATTNQVLDDFHGMDVSQEAVDAYKVFLAEVMTNKRLSPRERQAKWAEHPMAEEFKQLHDKEMIREEFFKRWKAFPANRWKS